MQDLLRFTRALADATRWRILQLVHGRALCVCELAEILDLPQSSVSSHLQVIRRAGLLDSERCEKWIYYRTAPEFESLLSSLGRRFKASPADHPPLARDATRARKRLARRHE